MGWSAKVLEAVGSVQFAGVVSLLVLVPRVKGHRETGYGEVYRSGGG